LENRDARRVASETIILDKSARHPERERGEAIAMHFLGVEAGMG
jgi:hypothetical protein